MNIVAAPMQAIAACSIARSTIDDLGEWVQTSADTRALAILADAIPGNLVKRSRGINMFFILSMFCAGVAFTFISRSQNIALCFWAVGAFFLFCDWRTNRR